MVPSGLESRTSSMISASGRVRPSSVATFERAHKPTDAYVDRVELSDVRPFDPSWNPHRILWRRNRSADHRDTRCGVLVASCESCNVCPPSSSLATPSCAPATHSGGVSSRRRPSQHKVTGAPSSDPISPSSPAPVLEADVEAPSGRLDSDSTTPGHSRGTILRSSDRGPLRESLVLRLECADVAYLRMT